MEHYFGSCVPCRSSMLVSPHLRELGERKRREGGRNRKKDGRKDRSEVTNLNTGAYSLSASVKFEVQ